MSRTLVLGLVCVHAICWFCAIAPAVAGERPASSVLHLTDGSFLPGQLCESADPEVLQWRAPAFARPLNFPLSAVHSVHYVVEGPQPKPRGEYCFELVGEGMLYGNLLALTPDEVEVDSPVLGRMHLQRGHIQRFYRWQGADLIYLGPNGLAGWQGASLTPQWRDEGGLLTTEQPGASLFSDLAIPDQAVIEVELSWKRQPDFVLALGVDNLDVAVQHAFQLEVWDDELVVVGESARDADLAAVQHVGAGEGSVRLKAYLDQKARSLLLVSPSGKPLASLHIDAKKLQSHRGVRLTNEHGDVRLEHLRITRWNGREPREVREHQARLQRTDGSIVYGRLAAYDPRSKAFTIRDGMTETVVKEDDMADIFLSPGEPAGSGSTDAVGPPSRSTLRLVYRDGSRFSGTLTRIEDTHLTLACPGVKELLRLPLAELRSVISLRLGERPPPPPVAGKRGRLEMEGVSLKGRLVTGKGPADASCLVWHPDLGLNASPLLKGLSGRIVYRDRQPTPSAPQPGPGPYQAVAPAGVRADVRVKGAIVQRRSNERVREQLWRMVPIKDGSGYVKLVHLQSGKVLAIAGKSNESGELAVLARDDGSRAQQWKFEKDGAYFKMVNRKSGKVLDVQGASMEEGAPIIQWDSKAEGSNDNQRWSWQGNGNVRRLRSKASGLVLDVGVEAAVVQRRVGLSPVSVQRPSGGRPSLHLRSGDTIPCEVTHIDEKAVTFKTPLSEATFVPHEKIKSVDLIAGDSPKLDETKRDRLLTLPRMQKDSPPTHLIFSENGDFLRGRVLEMDDKRLKVEVRLETREIPRDRIAQIVWLHADELAGRKPAPAAAVSSPNRVQIMREDGNRLTFLAQQADAQTISGTSDVLGACRADLDEVDQLLFGTSIEESAAKLADHSWKLHQAAEPKFAQADFDNSADGRPTGIESPLVGQQAFSFRLDMLDGRSFDLADHKGRVVVVDFWATWCGPCMQSMPLVESVVQEFAGRGVDLIAVNLEEDPEHVKSVAERHKLKVPVAFDRDSAVAAKYAVTAIPQTVVIDRDGKIARLFVGGGKKTADSLRKALQELSAAKPSAAP
jgi:thiol-disulfide isomerase/thioredoxin